MYMPWRRSRLAARHNGSVADGKLSRVCVMTAFLLCIEGVGIRMVANGRFALHISNSRELRLNGGKYHVRYEMNEIVQTRQNIG